MENYFFFKLLLGYLTMTKKKEKPKYQESEKRQNNEIYQIIIEFPKRALDFLLLLFYNILRKFIEEIIER